MQYLIGTVAIFEIDMLSELYYGKKKCNNKTLKPKAIIQSAVRFYLLLRVRSNHSAKRLVVNQDHTSTLLTTLAAFRCEDISVLIGKNFKVSIYLTRRSCKFFFTWSWAETLWTGSNVVSAWEAGRFGIMLRYRCSARRERRKARLRRGRRVGGI